MKDKEKEKGKSHPFTGHLNPTEEVLWMSVPTPPSTTPTARQQVLAMGAILIGVVIVLLVGVVSDKTPLFEKFAIVLTVSGIAGAALIVVFGVIWVFRRLFKRNHLPERAYAITNERLLYRNQKSVATIPLENLPSISLFLGDGDKGTFSFGAFFPMWPDVADAIRIKHLIDDAQKKRMQRL